MSHLFQSLGRGRERMIALNRVMITGMGAVTPIGNDIDSYWQGLVSGKCGIGPITKFDTADFKVKVAAEVKDFDRSSGRLLKISRSKCGVGANAAVC